MSGWITIDFRPAPAPVVTGAEDKPKPLRWQCLYLTGMTNTPYMAIPPAGWLTQRKDDEFRVVAAVCVSDGTVHAWDEVHTSNNVHTGRYPWCVIEPLPQKEWPSKHSARQRWQEIQGSIIIENSQE
jgi:hypothetical protein